MIIGVLSLCSCENDLREVSKIENIEKEEAVDIYHDVRIIFSDSAVVKAELTGPELRIYHDSTGNYEFQKGIQIVLFDTTQRETQRITAEYGVQRTIQGITEFRNNVVIRMADGSIIKTEELFYDENIKEYYNSVPISMAFKDERGNLYATSFRSDDKFEDIRGQNMTGFYIPSSNSPFPSFGR
ncbi:MAG TPA: LPS export ABC transporter periplasmic protein LptC [Sphingobacterium sp.]|nr:LPS export ABC transporter periplasmic protein LptC [Sphingobacterium sp.]